MGWNQGYSIMEATIIGAFDLGVLDRKLCKVLLAPYAGTDIDSGGKEGLTTRKGKLEIEEVVILAMGGKIPKRPSEPWREENQDEWDDYDVRVSDAFDKATRKAGW